MTGAVTVTQARTTQPARAIPTAKQPIGPHPTTNTVLPGISAVSTV